MDWQTIVRELTDRTTAGLTQSQLAKLCGYGQSTISELARGVTQRPNVDLGLRLLQLHVTTVRRRIDAARR